MFGDVDTVVGAYWAVVTLDLLPKVKITVVWKSVCDCFHAKSKDVLKCLKNNLSQRGKGHTSSNLPISVLLSNKHIHIDTQFYM